jgi:hypothetical protein
MLFRKICWSALRNGTEQTDQSQSGQQDFDCFVHWGNLRGWILMRAEVYARPYGLQLSRSVEKDYFFGAV